MKKETAEKAAQLIELQKELVLIKNSLSKVPICITILPGGHYVGSNISNSGILIFLHDVLNKHINVELEYLKEKIAALNDETVGEL